MVSSVYDVQFLEELVGFLLKIFWVFPCNADGHHHIFNGGELWQKLVVLEHEADVLISEFGEFLIVHFKERLSGDGDFRAVLLRIGREVQSAQNLQQGRFSGARFAYDGDDFALVYIEIHAFEDL